jgi:hypothetical protein
MLSAAEALTFNNLKKEEKKPLSTGAGEVADAVALSGGASCGCLAWSCGTAFVIVTAIVLVIWLV